MNSSRSLGPITRLRSGSSPSGVASKTLSDVVLMVDLRSGYPAPEEPRPDSRPRCDLLHCDLLARFGNSCPAASVPLVFVEPRPISSRTPLTGGCQPDRLPSARRRMTELKDDFYEETGGLVLNLECTLDAPPEEVFRMLTESAELMKWWGPQNFTIPAAELSLTEGGRYRFRVAPPDGEAVPPLRRVPVLPPSWRLVYTFRWEEPTPDDRETVVWTSHSGAPAKPRAWCSRRVRS